MEKHKNTLRLIQCSDHDNENSFEEKKNRIKETGIWNISDDNENVYERVNLENATRNHRHHLIILNEGGKETPCNKNQTDHLIRSIACDKCFLQPLFVKNECQKLIIKTFCTTLTQNTKEIILQFLKIQIV
jgi:hypothetical protein